MERRAASDGSVIVLSGDSESGSVIVLSGDSESDSGAVDMPPVARVAEAEVVATTEAEVTASFESKRSEFASQARYADKKGRLLACALVFETSCTRHGCYCSRTNTVRINRRNLAKGLGFVEETLLHELAHLISPSVLKAGPGGETRWETHGPAWRAVAQQLGCKYVGKRRASSPLREARRRRAVYSISCGCRGADGGLTRWPVMTDRGIAKYRGAVPLTCRRCRVAFEVSSN